MWKGGAVGARAGWGLGCKSSYRIKGVGWKDRDTLHQARLLKVIQNLALSTSTPSPGSLFQCLAPLTVKDFILISNLNFPSFYLYLVPLVISPQFLMRTPSPCSIPCGAPFSNWKDLEAEVRGQRRWRQLSKQLDKKTQIPF